MEERKSMGEALINVFDAVVILAKAEVNSIVSKLTEQAKQKGLGIVFIFAALIPLSMMLIFLILGFFFLLTLWLPLWGAAFVMAVVGLGLTALLVWLGMERLNKEVGDDPPATGALGLDSSQVDSPSSGGGALAVGSSSTTNAATNPANKQAELKAKASAPVATKPTTSQEETRQLPSPPAATKQPNIPASCQETAKQQDNPTEAQTTVPAKVEVQPELLKPIAQPRPPVATGEVKLEFPKPNTTSPTSPSTTKPANNATPSAGIPVSTKPTYKEEMGEE